MRKITILALVLLLMFSLTLAGCGAKPEEPAVEDPAGVSLAEVSARYNEVATFYGEVFAIVDGLGLYESDPEMTEHMDSLNHSLAAISEALITGETTDEVNAELNAVLDEIESNLGKTKELAESM